MYYCLKLGFEQIFMVIILMFASVALIINGLDEMLKLLRLWTF